MAKKVLKSQWVVNVTTKGGMKLGRLKDSFDTKQKTTSYMQSDECMAEVKSMYADGLDEIVLIPSNEFVYQNAPEEPTN